MNNNFRKFKSKKLIVSSIIAIAIISTIIYMLAYRYLIERPEAKAIDNNSISTSKSVTNSEVKSDDWNYKSDKVEVTIEKVEKGSGRDKVTYFVADVKLKDASYLKSAFAKNTFGRNIVETTSEIAKNNDAIFAINGDYYGFREDGLLIRNGQIYRDKPIRTAAAFYSNGKMDTFDETKVSSAELIAAGVTNTLSFGPVLVDDGTAITNFEKVTVDTNFGNRSIQDLNPRTGVGMVEPNHFKFVVVDGRRENYSKGMTLTEFAQLFKELGCTEAYNLDGGGSSTMYFMGRVVNSPLGEAKERKISDILYIKE